MQVSSINGSAGERMFVCVCVCVCVWRPPAGPPAGLCDYGPVTGRWNQARSTELLSHTQPGQARWLLTSLRLKLTSPHLPSLQGDRDAELPRQTHVWDNISLLSDSFICLWVFTPGISDSSFSHHTVWMHPKIQNWSCTSLKNLTCLLVSCLVSALHVLSHLLYTVLLSTRVFCSHLSSCLVFSPLCYLCFFTSGLFCFLSSNFVKFSTLPIQQILFCLLSHCLHFLQVSRCLLTSHFVPFFLILFPLFFCSCLNSSPLFKSNFLLFSCINLSPVLSCCLFSLPHLILSPLLSKALVTSCLVSSCLILSPLKSHMSSSFSLISSFKIADSSLLSPCFLSLSHFPLFCSSLVSFPFFTS